MQELKKINVLSVAKISALFGLVAGIAMSLYLWAFYTFSSPELLLAMGMDASLVGFKAYVTVILMQLVVTTLVGVIGALIYNGFSKLVGGVKVELKDFTQKKKK